MVLIDNHCISIQDKSRDEFLFIPHNPDEALATNEQVQAVSSPPTAPMLCRHPASLLSTISLALSSILHIRHPDQPPMGRWDGFL